MGCFLEGSHYVTKSKFCGLMFSEKRHWVCPQRGKTYIGAQKITCHRNFPMYFHGLHEAMHLPGELMFIVGTPISCWVSDGSLRYVCQSWCCENSFPGETWASLPSPPKDFPPNGKQNRILPKLNLADRGFFFLAYFAYMVWWGFPTRARCTSKQ